MRSGWRSTRGKEVTNSERSRGREGGEEGVLLLYFGFRFFFFFFIVLYLLQLLILARTEQDRRELSHQSNENRPRGMKSTWRFTASAVRWTRETTAMLLSVRLLETDKSTMTVLEPPRLQVCLEDFLPGFLYFLLKNGYKWL